MELLLWEEEEEDGGAPQLLYHANPITGSGEEAFVQNKKKTRESSRPSGGSLMKSGSGGPRYGSRNLSGLPLSPCREGCGLGSLLLRLLSSAGSMSDQ